MGAAQEFVLAYLEKFNPVPGADAEAKLAYDFLDAGHIDSFETMQMILTIEDHFKIRFQEEHLQSDDIRTVGGLAAIIEHLAAGGAKA